MKIDIINNTIAIEHHFSAQEYLQKYKNFIGKLFKEKISPILHIYSYIVNEILWPEEIDKLINLLAKAKFNDANFLESNMLVGMLYYKKGIIERIIGKNSKFDFNKAIQYFKNMASYKDAQPYITALILFCYYEMGSKKMGDRYTYCFRNILKKAKGLNVESLRFLYTLFTFYDYRYMGSHQKDKYSKSTAYFEKALKIRPNDYLSQRHMCANHILLGNFDEAMQLCYKCLSIAPVDHIIYTILGILQMQKSNYHKAVIYFKESIRLCGKFKKITKYRESLIYYNFASGMSAWQDFRLVSANKYFNKLKKMTKLNPAKWSDLTRWSELMKIDFVIHDLYKIPNYNHFMKICLKLEDNMADLLNKTKDDSTFLRYLMLKYESIWHILETLYPEPGSLFIKALRIKYKDNPSITRMSDIDLMHFDIEKARQFLRDEGFEEGIISLNCLENFIVKVRKYTCVTKMTEADRRRKIMNLVRMLNPFCKFMDGELSNFSSKKIMTVQVFRKEMHDFKSDVIGEVNKLYNGPKKVSFDDIDYKYHAMSEKQETKDKISKFTTLVQGKKVKILTNVKKNGEIEKKIFADKVSLKELKDREMEKSKYLLWIDEKKRIVYVYSNNKPIPIRDILVSFLLTLIKEDSEVACYRDLYQNCRVESNKREIEDYDERTFFIHKIQVWKEELLGRIAFLKTHIKTRKKTNKCSGRDCAGYWFEPKEKRVIVIRKS